MLPHQERVVSEKHELDDRLKKLQSFIHDASTVWGSLPREEQMRMIRQMIAMEQYSKALEERIAAFPL